MINIFITAAERRFFMSKKVAIIMGSDSDFPVVKSALAELKSYDIPFECRVMSAHRTPVEAADFADKAKAEGFGVIICAAGMAAHLAGVIAGHTTLPVIGIPMKSSVLDGMDALFSTVMMPPGVPVAAVGINGAKNAAILAVQILAVSDEALAEKLADSKKAMAEGVKAKDSALQEEISKEFK